MDNRLIFAQNLKRSLEVDPDLINRIMLSDETQTLTGCLGLYAHRLKSTRPAVNGVSPRFKKSLNLWAGISTRGSTKPFVINNI